MGDILWLYVCVRLSGHDDVGPEPASSAYSKKKKMSASSSFQRCQSWPDTPPNVTKSSRPSVKSMMVR